VATAYETYDLSYPHPAWAEQSPDDWNAAVTRACGQLVEGCPGGASAIRGISFGSQLDGMVAVDASGAAVRPAMIWMDRRAEAQAEAVAGRISPVDFYRAVGANLDSSHAVFKALWVRDEEPEVWRRTTHIMSPGSYVLRHVSGVLAVDYSNASSFALLDPRTRTWSETTLEATGIDPAMLPELGGGTQSVGTITGAFAETSGLDPSTVVAIGCGDEMAATLGAGVFEPGDVCDVVGTAEPVCAASDEPREDPTMLVECHPHADPDAWLLENPGFVSGGNPSSVMPRPSGSATRTTSCRPKPAMSRPARRDSSSSRACKGRWRPSGTAPPVACSTGSRSHTREIT
jgi:xylulokinase